MSEPKFIILAVVNSLLSVFGSLMNLVVASVIVKNPILQKGLNLLILSLCVADFMNCAISQPMYVHALLNSLEVTSTFNFVFTIIAFVTLHASTTNLVAMTLYRMKALSRPFTTRLLLVSKKQVLIAITLVWIMSIIIGVFFATNAGKLVAAYVHLAMTLAWIAGYVGLFWMVKQHKTKIVSLEGSPTTQLQTASLQHESEASKTSAILVASSLICFFPDIVLDFMGQADESRLAWGFTILFLSSSINPCLIVWRSHQFREVLAKTMRDLRQWKT
ncbi:hypothetical protein ACROYT_G012580 [Oculina patagonica]